MGPETVGGAGRPNMFSTTPTAWQLAGGRTITVREVLGDGLEVRGSAVTPVTLRGCTIVFTCYQLLGNLSAGLELYTQPGLGVQF